MPSMQKSASTGNGSPEVTGFYDKPSGSIQYLVKDPATAKAALIDVVRDFDPKAARIGSEQADLILRHVERENVEVEWILDTHPHADHLMASSYLKERLGAQNAIGEKVKEIADLWRGLYHLSDDFGPEGHFDRFFADGDQFKIGELDARVMFAPGHTLGSISYVVGSDAAFVHDTFMQPDSGTARADFPGADSGTLYETLQEILALPDHTRLFVGHDYGTETREQPKWESTVKQQKHDNKHIGGGICKDDFIKLRDERDATLALPDRMLHVLQMNLHAGKPPEAESDGNHYLKIPLDRF